MGEESEPRCDICGRAEGDSPSVLPKMRELDADWNGETGCHASCEALRKKYDWIGLRMATFDEVEDAGHSGSLMDGGADPETNGAWWTTVVDWADDDAEVKNPEVGTRVTMPDPPGPFAFDLDMRVVTQRGPGGGWPEVRVMGSFERMREFLAVYHDDPTIRTLSRDVFVDHEEWAGTEPIGIEERA